MLEESGECGERSHCPWQTACPITEELLPRVSSSPLSLGAGAWASAPAGPKTLGAADSSKIFPESECPASGFSPDPAGKSCFQGKLGPLLINSSTGKAGSHLPQETEPIDQKLGGRREGVGIQYGFAIGLQWGSGGEPSTSWSSEKPRVGRSPDSPLLGLGEGPSPTPSFFLRHQV